MYVQESLQIQCHWAAIAQLEKERDEAHDRLDERKKRLMIATQKVEKYEGRLEEQGALLQPQINRQKEAEDRGTQLATDVKKLAKERKALHKNIDAKKADMKDLKKAIERKQREVASTERELADKIQQNADVGARVAERNRLETEVKAKETEINSAIAASSDFGNLCNQTTPGCLLSHALDFMVACLCSVTFGRSRAVFAAHNLCFLSHLLGWFQHDRPKTILRMSSML